MDKEKFLYSSVEAAHALAAILDTLYELKNRGVLVPFQIPGVCRLYYKADQLRKFVDGLKRARIGGM